MDLRPRSTPSSPKRPIEALQSIPNKIQFVAIRDTIPVASNAEKGGLLLHLLHLCHPPEYTEPGTPLLRMLARALQPFSAPLRADRLADDERTAGDAQALLLEHWHELPPEARRVALAIDGADWQFHLRRAIQSPADPAKAGAIEAVLACLADIEARGTPVDRRIALALLASSDRRAADLAERVIRPRILAGVRTPDDERPPALRSAPATEPSPTADAVSAACAALARLRAPDGADCGHSHDRGGGSGNACARM